MKLTKYEHACLVLEEQGKKLLIDPSDLAKSLQDISNVVAVVITHDHFDHFSYAIISRIIAENPGVQIFTTPEVSKLITDHPTVTVTGGDTQTVTPFNLAFFGDMHATVYDNKPITHNIGVLVNNTLYYPGDSFTVPEGNAISVLALPTSGPWLKLSEAAEFVKAVHPEMCFPTHNALHSQMGEQVANNWLKPTVEKLGAQFQPLDVSESLEI